MEEKDLQFVVEIENLSFPTPWQRITFLGEIQNHSISFPFVIVNREVDRVVGYVIYWRIRDEIQISNIAIHPDYRRKSLAETVIRWILDDVKKGGVKFVVLEVRPSNSAARSLYEKLGFKTLGLRKNYYHHPPEDALIMGRVLASRMKSKT